MTSGKNSNNNEAEATRDLLSGSGYAQKAIDYFLKKAYMGTLAEADHVSEMTGSCGDTMKIYLKFEEGKIADARYQVLGCPGAVASAMAAVEAIKGKPIEDARRLSDNDIFKMLEEIPAKKHHCIQLAVKTLHKALDEHKRAG
jgi:nitrogen fixation NifU-like protein